MFSVPACLTTEGLLLPHVKRKKKKKKSIPKTRNTTPQSFSPKRQLELNFPVFTQTQGPL